jgi:hypothetical protein
MENKNTTAPVQHVRHVHVVRDAYGRPVRKKKSKAKKIGIAAAVIAAIVPLVLMIRAFVTSEDAKKNRKAFTKKYKKISKNIRSRF